MKKLALLLGALSLVSSVAYAKEVVPAVEEVVVVEEAAPVAAAPALTVTYVGQSLEVDNDSGSSADIGEAVHFGNSVGLAYGDWTFDLFARKTWSMDTDDGIHSSGHRLQLDAWKQVNDNLAFGLRYRGQNEFDRYYLRTKYNYGMFSGNIDVAYQSNNGAGDHEDAYYVEAIPVAVTVGPVTVGYYVEADTWSVNTKENGFEHKYRQQLRVGAPLYTGEKLSLGLEYRWQFDTDVEYDKDAPKYEGAYKEENSNTHILYLSGSYALTENLSIDGYYQYDMKEFDAKDGTDKEAGVDDNKYYGEFCIGWTYTF
mgnify:CR=1 FL=1